VIAAKSTRPKTQKTPAGYEIPTRKEVYEALEMVAKVKPKS